MPDWAIRVSIAMLYFLVGLGKFSSSFSSHWVTMFEQIQGEQWFRYFTGIVESSAALLVLIRVRQLRQTGGMTPPAPNTLNWHQRTLPQRMLGATWHMPRL